MTVSGFTIFNAERHSAHTRDSPNPEKAISVVQCQAFLCGALQNSNLIAQRYVLELQSGATFHHGRDHD